VPPGFKKIDLTPRWSVNPAFCAQVLPDRGGVAWTGQENGSVKAYSLNPEGWVVWRLCDGQRSQEQIGSEFAQQTGRPAAEARGFLRDLQRKGLVVQGGYLVASADFPEGPVVREAPEGPEGAEQEREEFR
jgi:hypothetical protein